MALILCIKCKQISDYAEVCPNCGFSIKLENDLNIAREKRIDEEAKNGLRTHEKKTIMSTIVVNKNISRPDNYKYDVNSQDQEMPQPIAPFQPREVEPSPVTSVNNQYDINQKEPANRQDIDDIAAFIAEMKPKEIPSVRFPPRAYIEDYASVICPRCKERNSYHAGTKGFGLGKAALGGLLLGPVGLLAGLVGSNNLVIQCINCGNKWSP